MHELESLLKVYQQGVRNGSSLTPREKIGKWFDFAAAADYGGHESSVEKILTLESADVNPTQSDPHHARTVFSLTIPHDLCNITGNLHGAAVALIFDLCTSLTISIASKSEVWTTGHVSRRLQCTYLRPAPEGAKILVESRVIHLGNRAGYVVGRIKTQEEGKICYICEHDKVPIGNSALYEGDGFLISGAPPETIFLPHELGG